MVVLGCGRRTQGGEVEMRERAEEWREGLEIGCSWLGSKTQDEEAETREQAGKKWGRELQMKTGSKISVERS